jgi:hypothetical protein
MALQMTHLETLLLRVNSSLQEKQNVAQQAKNVQKHCKPIRRQTISRLVLLAEMQNKTQLTIRKQWNRACSD